MRARAARATSSLPVAVGSLASPPMGPIWPARLLRPMPPQRKFVLMACTTGQTLAADPVGRIQLETSLGPSRATEERIGTPRKPSPIGHSPYCSNRPWLQALATAGGCGFSVIAAD